MKRLHSQALHLVLIADDEPAIRQHTIFSQEAGWADTLSRMNPIRATPAKRRVKLALDAHIFTSFAMRRRQMNSVGFTILP